MSFGTLTVTYPDGRRQTVDLTKPTVDIGSGADNDLVLYDNAVDPVHAQLLCDDSGCQVLDLGSANGTWLGGVRLQPQLPEPLADDAALLMGGVTLRYFVPTVAEEAPPEEPPVVVPPPPPAPRWRPEPWLVAAALLVLLLLAAYLYRSRLSPAPPARATPAPAAIQAATSTAPSMPVATEGPVVGTLVAQTASLPDATAAPTSAATEQPILYVVTTAGNRRLNVRLTPGETAPIVGQLAPGTVVRQIEEPQAVEGSNWIKVEAESVAGWCILDALVRR